MTLRWPSALPVIAVVACGGSPAAVDAASQPDASSDGRVPTDGGTSYATEFSGTESPISEGGAWTHLGLDWTLVDTAGGIAYGTQTGTAHSHLALATDCPARGHRVNGDPCGPSHAIGCADH